MMRCRGSFIAVFCGLLQRGWRGRLVGVLSCYGGMDAARCWEGREETGNDLQFLLIGSAERGDTLPLTLDVVQ